MTIRVENLVKRFPLADGGELTAVAGVSFTVAAGEVYGLLGPNGAGKTTTIRMLLGLMPPTSGAASIAGYSALLHPQEVKARVGLVAAGMGLYQWLTVREALHYFALLYGVEEPTAAATLAELTPILGLREILDRRCAVLSTGQKQRVHLARALIHRPPVLLLDEPTLGLDVIGSQAIAEYIDLLRSQGKAVILTTHRLDEAERLCDRFGLLHRGSIVQEGTLAELRERTGCVGLVEMFLKLAEVGPLLAGDKENA